MSVPRQSSLLVLLDDCSATSLISDAQRGSEMRLDHLPSAAADTSTRTEGWPDARAAAFRSVRLANQVHAFGYRGLSKRVRESVLLDVLRDRVSQDLGAALQGALLVVRHLRPEHFGDTGTPDDAGQ